MEDHQAMSDQREMSQLEGDGFRVNKLSDFQYRVADRFDIMPNTRDGRWAWFDVVTKERGRLHKSEFRKFIPAYFKTHPRAARQSLTASVEPGWWNCPVEGCSVKMRDDGSSASARRQVEHLETHP
jgi:hypothetical protein